MGEALKILRWNANGIQLHKNEIELLLVTQNINILLVSETHLINNSKIFFKNYSCYQANHKTHGGRGKKSNGF